MVRQYPPGVQVPNLVKMIRQWHGKCCYCGHTMRPYEKKSTADGWDHPHRPTREHLKRRADGGSNSLDNLAPSCSFCNSHRGPLNWLLYKSIRMGEFDEAIEAFPEQRDLILDYKWGKRK